MEPATIAIIVLCSLLAAILLKDTRNIAAYLQGGLAKMQSPKTTAYDSSSGLWCRANLQQKTNNPKAQKVTIEICGTIFHTENAEQAKAVITLRDITDPHNKLPVKSAIYPANSEDTFTQEVMLGRMSTAGITLTGWAQVAVLNCSDRVFPRRGSRKLQCAMSVFSPNGTLLAQPCCRLDFDNQNPGCLEQQDKLEKVKNLAVAIALAVAGVDKHITNEEFNVISQWVRQNLSGQGTAEPAKIDKALRKAVHFFQAGKQLDTPGMCREILELASTGQRYDLMELFLKVAAADQCATARELQLLKKLSHNLQLDTERFRHMVETMLPLHMHQVEDAELVLGINGTMTPEQSRRQLNLEYRKWNARVTNADPAVKSQADQMLNLIAQARSQFA